MLPLTWLGSSGSSSRAVRISRASSRRPTSSSVRSGASKRSSMPSSLTLPRSWTTPLRSASIARLWTIPTPPRARCRAYGHSARRCARRRGTPPGRPLRRPDARRTCERPARTRRSCGARTGSRTRRRRSRSRAASILVCEPPQSGRGGLEALVSDHLTIDTSRTARWISGRRAACASPGRDRALCARRSRARR
jgi:hypothetical protein